MKPRRWILTALAASAGLVLALVLWAHWSGWLFLLGVRADGELEIEPGSVVTVPATVEHDLVFVSAEIGSRPVDLLLDTGFQFTVINADRAESLGLEVGGWREIPSGTGSVRIGFVPPTPIELGEARFVARRLPAVELGFLEPYLGRPLGGILGHDFFATAVVELDYSEGRVVLHEPVGFEPPPDLVSLPVVLRGREVFVRALLDPLDGSEVDAELKLDTGSISALGLEEGFVEEHDLLGSGQLAVRRPGVGLQGPTEGSTFRLEALSLGPFTWSRPLAQFTYGSTGSGEEAGTLGGAVLHRFSLTLDYFRSRILLKPNSELTAPFAFDASGLTLLAAGPNLQGLEVHDVRSGSPAGEAGLRPADRILRLDGRSARSVTLAEAQTILAREGRTVSIRIGRSGSTRDLVLDLRSPLP